jgi:hypothetical protein
MTALDPIRGAAPSRRMPEPTTIGMPSTDGAIEDLLIEIDRIFITPRI